MTGRHAVRRPPPPRPALTPRLTVGIAAAFVGGLALTAALGTAAAPRVAADTRLAFPAEPSEPVGHGGLGGPLVLPSIGAVTSETARSGETAGAPNRPGETGATVWAEPTAYPQAPQQVPGPGTTAIPSTTVPPAPTTTSSASPSVTDTPQPTTPSPQPTDCVTAPELPAPCTPDTTTPQAPEPTTTDTTTAQPVPTPTAAEETP